MAELPSHVFFVIGGVMVVFSFLYNLFLETNSLTLFVITGVLFIIYGTIKYFFMEGEERKKKKAARQHHKLQQAHQQKTLQHRPLRQKTTSRYEQPAQYARIDLITCPQCGTRVDPNANFCPNCGLRRSRAR